MKRKFLMALALTGMLTKIPGVYGTAIPVQAAQAASGELVQPRYVNTSSINADLVISGSTAHCYANATAKRSCHINVKMRLQRKDGSSWSTVCSWVGAADGVTKTLDKTFSLSTRGSYRVNAEFNVGGEVLTYNSSTKTY